MWHFTDHSLFSVIKSIRSRLRNTRNVCITYRLQRIERGNQVLKNTTLTKIKMNHQNNLAGQGLCEGAAIILRPDQKGHEGIRKSLGLRLWSDSIKSPALLLEGAVPRRALEYQLTCPHTSLMLIRGNCPNPNIHKNIYQSLAVSSEAN